MRVSQFKNTQHGLSLIELMVAITLGLLLTAAVIQVFVSNRTAFRSQDSQSRMQEGGRFVIDYLTRDIRMAGFVGCPKIDLMKDEEVQSLVGEKIKPTASNIIFGFDNVTASTKSPIIDRALNAVPNTDVLVIRKAVGRGVHLTESINNVSSAVVAFNNGDTEFKNGDLVILSDCQKMNLYEAINVTKTDASTTMAIAAKSSGGESEATEPAESETANPEAQEGGASNPEGGEVAETDPEAGTAPPTTESLKDRGYSMEAEVFPYEVLTYFIRDTERETPAGNPIYALYMLRANTAKDRSATTAQAAVELIDGVEDMQLQYGLDINKDLVVDEYKVANDVTDWSQVVSVKLHVLMHSTEDNVAGKEGSVQEQSIQFNGETITSEDGRLRKVFTTTVALRSRLP